MDVSLIQQFQRVSVDVAELYSPPWVTAEAQKFGLKTGEAIGNLTGWDFQGRAQADGEGVHRQVQTHAHHGQPDVRHV